MAARKRIRDTYVADFETTTIREDCRVWAYGMCRVDAPNKVWFGNDLVLFMRELVGGHSVVYFHNL